MAVTIKKKGSKPKKVLSKAKERHTPRSLIASLGADRLEQVDSWLTKDISVPEITRRIQEDWGLMTEAKPATVYKAIYRYKEMVLAPRLAAAKHSIPMIDPETAVAQITNNLNVVEEFYKLAVLQADRVRKGYEQEKKGIMLNRFLHKDITAFASVLKDLVDVQMDMGIIPRVSSKQPPNKTMVNVFPSGQNLVTQVQVSNDIQAITLEALKILRNEPVQEGVDAIGELAGPE